MCKGFLINRKPFPAYKEQSEIEFFYRFKRHRHMAREYRHRRISLLLTIFFFLLIRDSAVSIFPSVWKTGSWMIFYCHQNKLNYCLSTVSAVHIPDIACKLLLTFEPRCFSTWESSSRPIGCVHIPHHYCSQPVSQRIKAPSLIASFHFIPLKSDLLLDPHLCS